MTIEDKVREYVYTNYKHLKDKPIIIREYDSHFSIQEKKDASVLILGKGIV